MLRRLPERLRKNRHANWKIFKLYLSFYSYILCSNSQLYFNVLRWPKKIKAMIYSKVKRFDWISITWTCLHTKKKKKTISRDLPNHWQSSLEAAPRSVVVFPEEHFKQLDCLKLGWYVPTGQAMQLARPLPSCEYSPGPHTSTESKDIECQVATMSM